ncbi:MAG: SpoIIE family protein phosphatase [Bacteroidia bacterium]|nr:SpoIIE family protein phosphatase [Bacteroidia bacterium]
MKYKFFENLKQSLESYKATWLLKMKSRVKSKFIFFAIPLVLMLLGLELFGSESQKDTYIFIPMSFMMLLIIYYFNKTEKTNILITKQKEELSIQKNIIEAQKTEVEIAKLIIEKKNRDITDSITYAKRIQEAKLPKKEEIYSSFPQSFILFKPKDIVSGDFYFFHKNNKSVFIAAADCTGHGIPGAFMSMIGSEKLEDAVLQSNDTSEILKQLSIGIKTSLKQSESDESTRDGMDIAICSVDTENRIVKYAGANRPIWLIRKGQIEVEETKATKKAIGGLTEDEQHFDTHELNLKQGDTFYIFTDGYVDQFNDKNKKLLTKKFKEILLVIQDKSMQEQEEYLDDFIENWKADTDQVDDILVIGVRL